MKDKKVLLRCDFDVPLAQRPTAGSGRLNIGITETFRIEKQKPVIDFLLKQSAVVAVAHTKAAGSFKDIIHHLEKILDHKIIFFESIGEFHRQAQIPEVGKMYLLDNIRNWPGEKQNNESFARMLAKNMDIYINNDFAVSHRKHASIEAITRFLPSYPGLLVEEEVSQLSRLIGLPSDGKIFIIGGAKTKTKIPVIKNFIDKAQNILVGGVVANDILRARGVDIGLSVADENPAELIDGLDITDQSIVIPVDFNI